MPVTGSAGKRVVIEFKGGRCERDIIVWAVSWYLASNQPPPLEETLGPRGAEVDHAMLDRWVRKKFLY